MLKRTLLSLSALSFLVACSTDDPTQAGGESVGAVVVETMNSGGYTYVHLEQGGKQDWYAVPECAVAVGDRVEVEPGAMVMQDFESRTLNRTFNVIYFASGLEKVGAADVDAARGDAARGGGARGGGAPGDAAHGRAVDEAGELDSVAVAKADGGMTVAEVFAKGAAMAGEQVVLRGKVVKYNEAILGKNWVHVQDGTGGEGTNDITVTTGDVVEVGDVVLVKGTLAKDRDFGHGYFYELLIEDASVTVE